MLTENKYTKPVKVFGTNLIETNHNIYQSFMFPYTMFSEPFVSNLYIIPTFDNVTK